MKNLTKALVGTVAAGAMAVSTATPALARDHDDGIGAGEVLAGALVLGGIAAVAASASKDHGYKYDRDYRYRHRHRYRYGYGRGYRMHPDQAVRQCVNAVQRGGSRYSYGRPNVTEITRVKDKRDGFDVKGRVVVDSRRYGSRHHRYDRYRGYDSGKFTCKVRYGRIVDIDFSGLRGYY